MKRHPIITGCVVVIAFIVMVAVVVTALVAPPEGGGFFGGKKIAVVNIKGVIVDSREIYREIEKRRKDDRVAGVVVRINSPGGVVGPCQEIYSMLKKLDKEKPVIASMGSVAASGGYYIALGARKIFANPGTVTGSIGVLIEVSNVEGLMNAIKIRQEVIKSGPYKDIGSPFRELTESEREKLQNLVDDMFDQFVSAVGERRKMKKEEVLKLADGSIFTGRQALELGLVDEIGSLDKAIKFAAGQAGIKGEPSVIYPGRPSLWRELFEGKIRVLNGLIPWDGVRVMYLMQL